MIVKQTTKGQAENHAGKLLAGVILRSLTLFRKPGFLPTRNWPLVSEGICREVKQNFGFLAEQSGRYQLAYASVHLAAMRYTLIFEAMLRSGGLSYGEVRDKQTGKLQALSFSGLLWDLFRALIEGALDALVATLGQELVDTVMTAIDEAVDSFLTQALQMEPSQVDSQLKAEAAGYL